MSEAEGCAEGSRLKKNNVKTHGNAQHLKKTSVNWSIVNERESRLLGLSVTGKQWLQMI